MLHSFPGAIIFPDEQRQILFVWEENLRADDGFGGRQTVVFAIVMYRDIEVIQIDSGTRREETEQESTQNPQRKRRNTQKVSGQQFQGE